MPPEQHAHLGLTQASRLRVARLVIESPGITITELAERTGLHVNTLRDHLRVLEDEGVVRHDVEHRGTRGRPRSRYHPVEGATPNAVAQERVDAAKRRGDLLRRVIPAPPPVLDDDAVHQLDALYEHLDDLGLEPEIDDVDLEITLRPCAFHQLVDGNLDDLCVVHGMLVRTVLERAGGPLALDRIRPLVTPHRCALLLRRGELGGAQDAADGPERASAPTPG